MTERMTIAIHAMCALLQKDYKNVAFSAYNTGHKSADTYIAEQAFCLADAMIARERADPEKMNDLKEILHGKSNDK